MVRMMPHQLLEEGRSLQRPPPVGQQQRQVEQSGAEVGLQVHCRAEPALGALCVALVHAHHAQVEVDSLVCCWNLNGVGWIMYLCMSFIANTGRNGRV